MGKKIFFRSWGVRNATFEVVSDFSVCFGVYGLDEEIEPLNFHQEVCGVCLRVVKHIVGDNFVNQFQQGAKKVL